MKSLQSTDDDTRIGILICGHGSRNKLALQEFSRLVDNIRHSLVSIPVEFGYLEFALPVLTEALDRLRERNVNRVIAIPAMLFAACHAKNDIPALLIEYSARTGLRIDYGRELGVDNLMIGAAGARVRQALNGLDNIPMSKTMLVVVGRGSSDPDANSNVAKITRLLVECLGFGWGETVYSGVTFPLVEPGLRHCVRLGYKRIVVFPYFLFSGVLIERVFAHSQLVSSENKEIEFINAGYLSDHPLVVETFIERIDEVLNGTNHMNCSICKYRSNLLGFESEMGLPQFSHHYHVERGGDHESSNEEDNDSSVDRGSSQKNNSTSHKPHQHFPYPQADHPLGPVTLRKLNSNQS